MVPRSIHKNKNSFMNPIQSITMSETISTVYENVKTEQPFFIFRFDDGKFVIASERSEDEYIARASEEEKMVLVLKGEDVSGPFYPELSELSPEEAREKYSHLQELNESEYPSLSQCDIEWDDRDMIDNPQERINAIKDL